MGDVDGDEGDVGVEVFGGDGRRDGLVDLELDGQIDALADEVLGVAKCDLGLVAIVDDDELDVLTFGRPLEAAQDLPHERAVLVLGGVTDSITTATPYLGGQAIAVGIGLLEEPAMVKRVQEPEAHPLAEACALHDVAKAKRLARRLEGTEYLRRAQHRADEVRFARGLR